MGMKERLTELGERAGELADKATERARDLVAEHNDTIDEKLDRAAGFLDQQTKGKYSARIDSSVERAKQGIDRFGDRPAEDQPEPPADLPPDE
jgi:MT0933-like antitoxin protein